MIALFYAGGPLFMGILTLVLVAILWAKYRLPKQLNTLGKTAFALGFFSFMIGLYQLFDALEAQHVDVSPALLAGGLKNAIITPLYGTLLYVLSCVLQLFTKD